LFGEIVDGEMRLNKLGEIVRSHWMKLPQHHAHLQLDAFIVMPNHVHGILVLTDDPVGAGSADRVSVEPMRVTSKPALPGSADRVSVEPMRVISKPALPGSADRASVEPMRVISKPALPGSADRVSTPTNRHGISEMIRQFKTFSARRINRIRNVKGLPVWQRNYYEYIIRNDVALQHIQQYIHNNPLSWQQDQLHPTNPSKW